MLLNGPNPALFVRHPKNDVSGILATGHYRKLTREPVVLLPPLARSLIYVRRESHPPKTAHFSIHSHVVTRLAPRLNE